MALPKLTYLLLESWILSSCFKFFLKIFPILDTREIFHTVKTQLSLFPPLSQAAMKFAKLSRFISSLKFKLGLNIYFLKKNTLIYSVFIAWYLLRDISRCIRTQKGLLRTSSVIEKRASVYQCLSPRTKKIKHATERNISNDHRRLVVRKITNMGLMGGYRERTLDTYTKISNRSSAVFDRTLGF